MLGASAKPRFLLPSLPRLLHSPSQGVIDRMTMATQDQTIEFGEEPAVATLDEVVWGRLLPVSANARGVAFDDDCNSYIIGRSSQCNVVISDPGPASQTFVKVSLCRVISLRSFAASLSFVN